MAEKKEFKIVERRTEYYYTIVEAESREEAMKLYEEDVDENGQPLIYEYSDSGDCELIAVDERGPDGQYSITNDVQNGEFVE